MLIAEVGCNHKGDFAIAKEMIAMASNFVGRTSSSFRSVPTKNYSAMQNIKHHIQTLLLAMGQRMESTVSFLNLVLINMRSLWRCVPVKIGYMTSVWDITAAQQIAELKPARIKIPSACNTDHVMLQWLFECFSGEIHTSLGTSRSEEHRVVELARECGRLHDIIFVFMHV